MTYLEFAKKLGFSDLLICVLNEIGLTNEQIMTEMKITEPTIYNAQARLEPISEALKTIVGAEPKDLRNNDVQAIVDTFTQCFETTATSKYDRFAANRLAKKHGAKKIVQIIQILAAHSGDKYCPTINNIRQLEDKWPSIGNFFNKLQKSQTIEL